MRKFFGEPWDAPIIDDAIHVSTPAGGCCMFCREQIEDGDRGFILIDGSFTHAECEMLGILGHSYSVCRCTGFDTTSRASARELWRRVFPYPSITCPQCGRTSYHPRDIEEKYCGACHAFHEDMRRDA